MTETTHNIDQPTGKQRKGLLRNTGTVGGMTMLSRISGFARDIVFAIFFGASGVTDAFFVAFKIPNYFRRLFAEGAFSQAFIPVFAEYKEKRDRQALRDLISHIAGALGGTLLLLTSFMAIAAPLVILLFAPGFIDKPEQQQLAVNMLQFTAFYLLFISLVALAGAIQNSFQQFAVPAFTPILLNLSLIACAIWLRPLLDIPIMSLAIGTFVAGLVQLLFQIPFLIRLGMLPWPRFNWQHQGMRKVIKLMVPAMISSSVVQINMVLDTIMASFLIAGSVTWLYFSDRLVELPLGVFSIAIATVLLPNLSRRHAQQDHAAFSKDLDWGLRLSTLITTPATLGLALLAGPILISLFQYAEFDAYDAKMAHISLIAYAVGLPAFGYIKILLPGFFARQDTRTPLKITVYAMLIKLAFNLALVIPLFMQDIAWAHAGLALATSLAAWAQTAFLYITLRKTAVYQPDKGTKYFYIKVVIATALMSMLLWFITPEFTNWLSWSFWDRWLILMGIITSACLIYFSVLWLAGIRVKQLRGHH